MAKVDHIVLCGGAAASRRGKFDEIVRLDLGGDEPNVELKISNISRRLSTDVPDVIVDLIEIASYVYCADQAVTRGGEGVLAFGDNWRRQFIFHIPVRRPDVWSSQNVVDALKRTLSFLSDDEYEFRFKQKINAAPMQQYLELRDADSEVQEIKEVLLFSGGLDSLGGAVQEGVLDRRRVALVSHRSNPKISRRQEELVQGLKAFLERSPPLHVPVWVHKRGSTGREYTQRSRSFLYASLAFPVAHVFGLSRIRFYENGVVSLNLPISEQAIGARATRTTHPQVLNGFAELFSLLIEQPFAVENPFLWRTRAEVVNLIGDARCGDLIRDSVSCMHTHEQTIDKPHCGRCSQCVGRRFATLASRYTDKDPANIYKVDLLEGEREMDKDLTLVESFIRKATDMSDVSDLKLIERWGEVGRVLRHVAPLTSNEVAENIVRLHRKHALEVTGVIDKAISDHASDIREGRLSATCAIILAWPETYRVDAHTAGTVNPAPSMARQSQTPQSCKVPSHEYRGAGRKADAETNRNVARVIDSFKSDWRDHLPELCDALDHQKLPLPKSRKWKRKGCSNWTDVLYEDKEGLVKALHHRLRWVSRHPDDDP
ncbi:MAG: hypothetical protein ACR2IV_12695, partial [Bryobacteraceae bacterium]